MYDRLMSFTIFLDMLGFSNKIGKITEEEKAKDFILFMESNKGIFEIMKNLDRKELFNYNYDFKFTFISDSIVLLAYPKKLQKQVNSNEYYDLSIKMFMDICNKLLILFFNIWEKEKILLRGGISNKYSYIKNEFIVGEGIIEAYKLENKNDGAIYPRIILSNNLTNDIKFMKTLKQYSRKLYKTNKNIITKDEDNLFFFNYLNLLYNQEQKHLYNNEKIKESNKKFYSFHKKAIEEMELFMKSQFGKKGYEKIKAKYNWIKSYHNNNVDDEYKIM